MRAEPSGHPEGAQAPEGSPTICGGCLANARQDKEGLKGLLRAEPSGHPEGAQAPEGSPTIHWGCLASARQDS